MLIDDDEVAKLCDFGLATLGNPDGNSGMEPESVYTGTARYKARELFQSDENPNPTATFKGDIYALGCMMLEVSRIFGMIEHYPLTGWSVH